MDRRLAKTKRESRSFEGFLRDTSSRMRKTQEEETCRVQEGDDKRTKPAVNHQAGSEERAVGGAEKIKGKRAEERSKETSSEPERQQEDTRERSSC